MAENGLWNCNMVPETVSVVAGRLKGVLMIEELLLGPARHSRSITNIFFQSG